MNSKQTNDTVLITGGLGYVGGRLAVYIKENRPDISLRILTRKSPDQYPNWCEDLEVVTGDVLDSSSLLEAVDGVNTVIHLAAINENECIENPDMALEVNGQGTHRLLEACHSQGINRFIYFSTFHVYGPEATNPITEKTATRPVHPYAFTHRLAEDYVNWFRVQDKLDTMIFRLSNGFGYPADLNSDRWTLVFNDFCRQAVETGQIILRSKGTQHRDFVTLEDIARGTNHLLQLRDWMDGLINLGGDRSLSIYQAAELVATAYEDTYGRPLPIKLGDSEDPSGTHPVEFNIDKLKSTGFSLIGDMANEIRGTLSTCQSLVTNRNQVQ